MKEEMSCVSIDYHDNHNNNNNNNDNNNNNNDSNNNNNNNNPGPIWSWVFSGMLVCLTWSDICLIVSSEII